MANTQTFRTDAGNKGSTAGDTINKAKEQATSTYETVKEKASEAYDAAKSTAADALETAQIAGSVAYAQGKEAAQSIAGSAGEAITSTIEEQKSAGAAAVAKAAQSAREAAEGLEKDAPQIAGIIKTAATSVENFSNDIKDKTVTEIMDGVADFAQRRPMAFLACGVVAGMLVSRMLTSSNRA